VSTIKELSQDLLNNWDEHYPLSQFKPCTDFQGLPVNPDAKRQIQNNQFNQVPLIEILVKTFESLFPHLSIQQVRLLCKSTQNDGFQGWHQDMVRDLTETIVINLGSEANDDELETGKIQLVPGDAVSASNSNVFEEEDIEDCSFVQGAVAQRSHAMEKKNCKQEQNAMKGCGVGAIVSLKVEYRTNCHAPGLMAIVFAVRKETGGIRVCCEHDVITHSGIGFPTTNTK